MQRVRLLPFGFLIAAAITLAAPLLFALWAEVQPIDHVLHGTYYVVLPVFAWLWLILAPLFFGAAYFVGQRFTGLEFRRQLIWLNLVLWMLGAGILLAPTFALSAVGATYDSYTVGYSVDFRALDRILTLGYCVTLLSALVFAICFGEAVLKRLRRGKEL